MAGIKPVEETYVSPLLVYRTDPYFDNVIVENRLYDEYIKHRSLIVGVDFDNTLYDYHKQGDFYPALIDIIRQCNKMSFTVCLYTGNLDAELIRSFQIANDVTFDYINNSPVGVSIPSKPYFNILLDDRAGLYSAFMTLRNIIKRIRYEKQNRS